jgi:hypothetical protein
VRSRQRDWQRELLGDRVSVFGSTLVDIGGSAHDVPLEREASSGRGGEGDRSGGIDLGYSGLQCL